MSLLLDALRRNQNRAKAQEAPIELADVPPAETSVPAPAEASTAAPAESPMVAPLELTLDPIEAPPPAPLASALPELPELTELPELVEQPMTLATPEPPQPVAEQVEPTPPPPEVVVMPPPAPAPAAPVAAVVVVPEPPAPVVAQAPVSVPPAQAAPAQVPPRSGATAQEAAKAMFDATGTTAPSSPQRDGARVRRLQWSLVTGLVLAALTWMGWQYWRSTQTPGLTPTEGVQPAPGMVQGEVTATPPAEELASQAQASTPASTPVAANVTTPTDAAPSSPGTQPPVRATAAQPATNNGAGNRVRTATPTVASATPAQLVRSQAQQQLQSAWTALRQGDAPRAQALYQQVLAERPDDPDAALGLAVSLHRQRQHQAAWSAYQRSLQLWPDNETARTGMLAILSESDPDEAESRLQEWVQSRPRDAAAQAALGHLLGKQGRWAQALGPLTLAQSLAPNSATHAYNLAVGLDQARRYEDALQMYRLTQQLGAAGVPEQSLERRIQELQGASAR